MTFDAIVVASTLTDYLAPVSALVDECRIHCRPEGLSIAAVDPANVAMVDTALNAGAFESYETDGVTFGINLGQFEDVLALANSGDIVYLELDETTRKLDIRFGEVEYTQATIDAGAIRQDPDLPAIDAAGTVTATGDQLDRGVTAADLCSDHIEIGVSAQSEAIVFDAAGDTDDVQTTFNDDALVDCAITETARSLHSLDYLTDMVGVVEDDTDVTVEVADEMPVRLEYAHADGRASVEFLLSPRIAGDGA